jgi:hypothetical protein
MFWHTGDKMKLWQLQFLHANARKFRITFIARLKLSTDLRRLDCATLARGHDWRKSVSGDGKRFCARCGEIA